MRRAKSAKIGRAAMEPERFMPAVVVEADPDATRRRGENRISALN